MVNKILDLIEEYETIIIHRHIHPDFDAIGSQGGLAEIIQTRFPSKSIYVVGEKTKYTQFLYHMDKISDDIFNKALIIVCDTDYSLRISDTRYKKGDLIIKIDHHPNNDIYEDISWINLHASSVSEMVYELYESGKSRGYTLTDKAAYLLYCGIIGDTNRMLHNMTRKTFKIISDLVTHNIEFTNLHKKMYKSSIKTSRLKGYLLQNFEVTSFGVGFIKLDAKTLKHLKIEESDVLQCIDVFSGIDKIKAWMIFIETNNKINVRIRSNEANVNKFTEKYKGGGHKHSAGMAINTWDFSSTLLKKLEEFLQKDKNS